MRQGPCYYIKPVFHDIRIPTINVKWSWDHVICMMGIPLLLRQHLCTEMDSQVVSKVLAYKKLDLIVNTLQV